MKKNNLSLKKLIFLLFFPTVIFAQLGVNSDNSAPSTNAMLDVKSATKGVLIPRVGADLASPTEGLLYYNTTGHNFRYYDGTAWQNALFGNQWNINGSKISYSLGNVGIGNTNPLYNLDINGTLHTEGYGYIDGFLSVGGNAIYPSYKLQVNDGSMAIYNSGEGKVWTLNYASGLGLRVLEDGLNARMTFENGGNVGIGMSPAYKLDVAGAIRSSGNIQTQANLAVTGSATINGGKGVAYNLLDDNNIKIARFVTPQPSPWGMDPMYPYPISAHGSREITIDLPAGFTSTPTVMVASQHSTGGSVGELYRAILVIYNCNTTQCTGKIINTDNSAIDYWVRWNLVAMQF
jgi:hypothetical protein